MATKPTLATLKSFVARHRPDGSLLVRQESHFDPMVDAVERIPGAVFAPISESERAVRLKLPLGFDNTLGVSGIYLVGSSRDSIEAFEENGLVGFKVWNCCGSFSVAVKKEG